MQAELAAGEAHVFELRRVLEAERTDVAASAAALAEATAQAQARPPPPSHARRALSRASAGARRTFLDLCSGGSWGVEATKGRKVTKLAAHPSSCAVLPSTNFHRTHESGACLFLGCVGP